MGVLDRSFSAWNLCDLCICRLLQERSNLEFDFLTYDINTDVQVFKHIFFFHISGID